MNKKFKITLKVLAITAAVFVIQTISYFVIAEYFGNLFGIENTLNFQLEVDKITTWFTSLFAIYPLGMDVVYCCSTYYLFSKRRKRIL
jgi:hypothetical protein